MIRSMTGYGDAERETPLGTLRVEMKTVNHRFLSTNLRLPSALDRHEAQIRDWLREELTRGHVNYSLRLDPVGDDGDEPRLVLNESRARQYHRVLTDLKSTLELPGEIDLALMARFNDLVEREETEAAEVPLEALCEVTLAATRAVVSMREAEGTRLRADLEARLEAIEGALAEIRERAPRRLTTERDRLREAVRELAEGAGVDEDRLAREIAMLAERWDISEEIVRLESHIGMFHSLLEEPSAEPVGKRLSFLVQEMLRETNTIGSKANDAAIEHGVVAIKNEIERLREQADNVE